MGTSKKRRVSVDLHETVPKVPKVPMIFWFERNAKRENF